MRKAFNIDAAVTEAWELIWKRKAETQKKFERELKKTGKRPFRYAEAFYTTATDLERMVRAFAYCDMKGKPRSEADWYWGDNIRIHTGQRQNLLGVCRDFLLRNPNITGHNFGHGHISGMRFRPRGAPMAESELETIVRKERPKPYHWRVKTDAYRPTKILCTVERKHSPFARRSGRGPYCTDEVEKVTCPRCLKLLQAKKEETAA